LFVLSFLVDDKWFWRSSCNRSLDPCSGTTRYRKTGRDFYELGAINIDFMCEIAMAFVRAMGMP